VDSVDRLTLVELIESEKAKLSPPALELWEEWDASIYLSPDNETRLKSHEIALIRRMAELPRADRSVIRVLRKLRAGLYQSDYSEQRGEPAEPHRNQCVIRAAVVKEMEAGIWGEDVQSRTVDQALARLNEGG
jgi:hypothetical protein